MVERESIAHRTGTNGYSSAPAGRRFFRLSNIHYEDVTAGRMPTGEFVARLRNALERPW